MSVWNFSVSAGQSKIGRVREVCAHIAFSTHSHVHTHIPQNISYALAKFFTYIIIQRKDKPQQKPHTKEEML